MYITRSSYEYMLSQDKIKNIQTSMLFEILAAMTKYKESHSRFSECFIHVDLGEVDSQIFISFDSRLSLESNSTLVLIILKKRLISTNCLRQKLFVL